MDDEQPQFCRLWGLPRCKNLWCFFFVSLARAGVWLLFNGLLAPLFSLFYVICEFDRFLHRAWARLRVAANFNWRKQASKIHVHAWESWIGWHATERCSSFASRALWVVCTCILLASLSLTKMGRRVGTAMWTVAFHQRGLVSIFDLIPCVLRFSVGFVTPWGFSAGYSSFLSNVILSVCHFFIFVFNLIHSLKTLSCLPCEGKS